MICRGFQQDCYLVIFINFSGRTLSHSFHFTYFLYNILTPTHPYSYSCLDYWFMERNSQKSKPTILLNHFLLEIISAYLSPPCPISYSDDLVCFFLQWDAPNKYIPYAVSLGFYRDFILPDPAQPHGMPPSTAHIITSLSLRSCRTGNIQLTWNPVLSRGLCWF